MVKRILENERYLGMDGYPQLVTDEEFLAVRLRRGEQNTYAPCPSEIIPIRDKAVCALCGEKMARDTKSRGRPRWRCKNPECGGSVYLDDSIILERVVQKLKVLAHSPECIRLPKAAPASTDALRIENELALCFNRADINPEYMKTLIMAAAAERYAGLNDPTPAHRRALLRQKLELEPENEETLWELFESAVTHVCIGKGGEISLAKTRLMAQKAELEKEQRGAAAFESRLAELDMALEQASGTLTDFDELTVRQLVSNIKVLDKDSLLICFKDGTEITQAMQRRQAA